MKTLLCVCIYWKVGKYFCFAIFRVFFLVCWWLYHLLFDCCDLYLLSHQYYKNIRAFLKAIKDVTTALSDLCLRGSADDDCVHLDIVQIVEFWTRNKKGSYLSDCANFYYNILLFSDLPSSHLHFLKLSKETIIVVLKSTAQSTLGSWVCYVPSQVDHVFGSHHHRLFHDDIIIYELLFVNCQDNLKVSECLSCHLIGEKWYKLGFGVV